MRERRLSVDEMAMKLLEGYLRSAGYSHVLDVRWLYDLLVEDRVEEACQKVFELIDNVVKTELGREKG